MSIIYIYFFSYSSYLNAQLKISLIEWRYTYLCIRDFTILQKEEFSPSIINTILLSSNSSFIIQVKARFSRRFLPTSNFRSRYIDVTLGISCSIPNRNSIWLGLTSRSVYHYDDISPFSYIFLFLFTFFWIISSIKK